MKFIRIKSGFIKGGNLFFSQEELYRELEFGSKHRNDNLINDILPKLTIMILVKRGNLNSYYVPF